MQYLPKDILRLLSHYLEWVSIFELSFCCKVLNFLSKDRYLFQLCVDKKYPIDDESMKKYWSQLHYALNSSSCDPSVMVPSTIISRSVVLCTSAAS